jgi:molecular chaperone GrpE (heat shock protein)
MHEALTTKVVSDVVDDGRVVEVFDSGYRVGDQVVRAARVVIGRYQEPAGDA